MILEGKTRLFCRSEAPGVSSWVYRTPASESGRWSGRCSAVTARASGDVRFGSREHHWRRHELGSKSGLVRPGGAPHGHHMRTVPARARDTGCHGRRIPTDRPCTRNSDKIDIFTFHVDAQLPIFATTMLDEDDDSRRKQSIHRVVRVKTHTTRTSFFDTRLIFVENERSASEHSTALGG